MSDILTYIFFAFLLLVFLTSLFGEVGVIMFLLIVLIGGPILLVTLHTQKQRDQ